MPEAGTGERFTGRQPAEVRPPAERGEAATEDGTAGTRRDRLTGSNGREQRPHIIQPHRKRQHHTSHLG